MKRSQNNGLVPVRNAFKPAAPAPGIQKVTQLTRLSSSMEPLESRTLMSTGHPSTDLPLLAAARPAAMKAPVSNLKTAVKTPAKTTTPVKTPAPVSAPTALVAHGLTTSSIKLNWTVTGSNTSSVVVLRSTDGLHFTQVTKLAATSAGSYVDSGLKENIAYSYQVQAQGAGGVTATSPITVGATLLISPTGLKATVATGGAVQLIWTENDPTANGYVILRSTDNVNFTQISKLSTTSVNPHTFSDNAAGSLTKYYYEVEATNQVTTSPASASASITTPLSAPIGLTTTATSPTSAKISWSDNDAAALGYSILRATGNGGFTVVQTINSGQTHTWTDTTLSSDTAYSYEIKALNGSTMSVATAVSRVSTPLVAPSSLAAVISDASVSLSWTNNDSNTTGYAIARSTDGVHFTPLTTITGQSTVTYTDSTVLSGHSYSYQIIATAGSATSAVSNTASIITPLISPSSLTVNGQSGNAVLTWTDNDTYATGYSISRSTNGTTFVVIAKLTGASAVTYTDSSVAPSTTYYYKVTATNAIASSSGGSAVQVTTPVGMPAGLTASASGSTVLLAWTDKDPLATGYNILRSSDGVTYTQIDTLSDATASSYNDSTVNTGAKYFYEVQAVNGSAVSSVSNSANAIVPLLAPTGLTVLPTNGSAVLTWTNADTNATGYAISRSTDGVNFSLLTKLSNGSATTYTDSTVSSTNTYYYEIQATNTLATSPQSSPAQITMPVQAVTNLTATPGSAGVVLTWTDNDSSATGYKVLRSTDGSTFTTLSTVTQGSATTYTDFQVTSGTQYYYQVQAVNGSVLSAVSTTANATATVTPPSPTTVKITTRYTNELVITATGATDTVSISQSGSTLTITANGQVTQQPIPANGLFIYARGGTDGITIGSSVTVQTTIEAIDGAVDTISSAGTNVGVWDDSNDIFTGTGTVHSVGSFASGVSKASGASLANPTDAGTTMKATGSLWGSGPVAGDINQGDVGDCYFMSSLAAFAGLNPKVLQQSAVDMGDGTYTVDFQNNGTPTYVRVSNDISTWGGGSYVYAKPGASGSIWGAILEKAFAFFRTGANTYNSINSGWMGSVYSLFGVSSTFFYSSSVTTDAALYSKLSADLSAHHEVTMGTFSSPPQLVGGHAYTLISVSKNSSGAGQYYVRNPWGVSGDSLENSQGYATLTYTQFVANFQDVCEALS